MGYALRIHGGNGDKVRVVWIGEHTRQACERGVSRPWASSTLASMISSVCR